MNKNDVVKLTYHEWTSSMDGPCCAWHGAGYSARGICTGGDGRDYVVEYKCEKPNAVTYSVALDENEVETYSNLREAAKSEFVGAFREVRKFALSKRNSTKVLANKRTTRKRTTMIKASKLFKKIQEGEWEAEVENDDDCYPQLFDATLEADGGGRLSLVGYYGYREDSPRYGVSLGTIVVQIDGVKFSAERIAEGEIDEWEISGAPIKYDNDLTEADLTEALEVGDLPHYSSDEYEFEEGSVSASDLEDACDSYPEYLVETEKCELLGFDDEDDIPEGAKPLELGEVIQRLFDEGSVSYESWY